MGRKKVILKQTELDRLAAVIGEMESRTLGEIRLMIVDSSSHTAHVLLQIWTLTLSLLFLIFLFEPFRFLLLPGAWLIRLIFLAGILTFGWLLSFLPCVRRGFIPHRDRSRQVWVRAELEFYREGLNQTRAHTGILLFLSRLERQAVVLADKAVAEKLPASTWDDVVGKIQQGAKTGQWAKNLEEAIRLCGEHLREKFPLPPGQSKSNELSNQVVVKP